MGTGEDTRRLTLNITINEGISKVTVLGKTYTSSTTDVIEIEEDLTTVSWSASTELGYKGVTTSGNINIRDEQYPSITIQPTCTYMGYYNITVTVNDGVNSITVNGTKYYYSRTLSFLYGTYVSWSAVAESGYAMSSSSGSFTVTAARSIAPTAKKTYTVRVTINKGVSSITVNSASYTSSTTLTFNSGTKITWSAKSDTSNGYKLDGDSSGSFTLNDDATIAPTATVTYYNITFECNEGIKSYKVGSTTYSTTTTLSYKYYSTCSYSNVTCNAGFQLSSSSNASGSFTVTGDRTISPSYKIATYSWTTNYLVGNKSYAYKSVYSVNGGAETTVYWSTLEFTHGDTVSYKLYYNDSQTGYGLAFSGTDTVTGPKSFYQIFAGMGNL